jgi:hypothetical protein
VHSLSQSKGYCHACVTLSAAVSSRFVALVAVCIMPLSSRLCRIINGLLKFENRSPRVFQITKAPPKLAAILSIVTSPQQDTTLYLIVNQHFSDICITLTTAFGKSPHPIPPTAHVNAAKLRERR